MKICSDKFMHFLLLLVSFVSAPAITQERPNIILILADDLGYSDLGAFGGEIHTPNLDAIAKQGIQLTNFHTGPTCGPTRAMLMTGIDHHRAGMGSNSAALRRLTELQGQPGYEGYLNNRVVTFASLLQDSGYHTFMTGKWDLGKQQGQLPTDRGFDHYFGLADGGASHFSDGRGNTSALEKSAYFEDAKRINQLPDDFYSSATYTDRLLSFIKNKPEDGQPFFGYLAYTAPHWPIQVPDEWIEKYKGKYDQGWHNIRQTRFNNLIELGLIPINANLPSRNRAVDSWDKITPSRKKIELKRMELYASMVELMDFHIGRLLKEIKETTDRETIIIFLSDNGSEGNAIGELGDNENWIPATFDNRISNMGKKNSYVWLGAGWGQATVSPFRIYKSYTTEGGIRTPAIFYSTSNRFKNSRKNSLMTVMDIAPTILELANVDYPSSSGKKDNLLPIQGKSGLDYLIGKSGTIHKNSAIGWELYGNRAIFLNDWKATLIWPPEGDGEWQLFDTKNDPTEVKNLAKNSPEILNKLKKAWDQYAKMNGVFIFNADVGYGRYNP